MSSLDNDKSNDFIKLSKLLKQFNGSTLEETSRLLNLKSPIFCELCGFIEFLLESKAKMRKINPNERRFITFIVKATYDKSFYCAAKIADKAVSIRKNEEQEEYYVSFFQNQLEEIEMMCYAVADPNNPGREDLTLAKKILRTYNYDYFVFSSISEFLGKVISDYGWQPILSSSFLVDTLKSYRRKRQQKYDKIFSDTARENRIQAKWSNEYRLFILISSVVEDAFYQYKADWLKGQSFDIFIPSQKIAIEYQGKQHYEPIKFFGGQLGFEETVRRYARKKAISEKQGVTVLYWKYTTTVNRSNVLKFLCDNKIHYLDIPSKDRKEEQSKINMAPRK